MAKKANQKEVHGTKPSEALPNLRERMPEKQADGSKHPEAGLPRYARFGQAGRFDRLNLCEVPQHLVNAALVAEEAKLAAEEAAAGAQQAA